MAGHNEICKINFALSHDPQPLRLIELPPSLLEEVAVKGTTLELKSIGGSANGNAVICSSSQTFSVRQNQSSNSLFVTETALVSNSDGGNPDRQFLRAMAQPEGMLEITPASPDALGHLRQVMPIMNKRTILMSQQERTDNSSRPLLSRTAQLKSAPFSSGEFLKAFEAVCGFESDGTAWIPSPDLMLDAWKAISLEAPPLGGQGEPTAQFPHEEVILRAGEDGGFPKSLLKAVIRRTGSINDDTAIIDSERCVAWVGDALFLTNNGSGVDKDDFVAQWRDRLPSSWRNKVSLDKLTTPYVVSEDGKTLNDTSMVKESNESAKAASKPLSKWHERLKASRR